jgi:hypothetical protein
MAFARMRQRPGVVEHVCHVTAIDTASGAGIAQNGRRRAAREA